MVYFKTDPVPQDKLDLEQYKSLQEVKGEYRNRGLVAEFRGEHELEKAVILHITNVISALLEKTRQPEPPPQVTAKLDRPDLRVKVQPGMVALGGSILAHILGVRVENHSSTVVYLSSFHVELQNRPKPESMLLMRDSVTRQALTRRALNPGESFTFNIDPSDWKQNGISDAQVKLVYIVDDIGRSFESDPDQLRKSIESVRG